MKILIISSKYLPAVGGLETAVLNIALELKKRGHQISILTNRYRFNLPCKEQIEGVCVERYFFTDLPPREFQLWIFFKYLIRFLLIPITFGKLLLKLSREKPEIVHLHFAGAPSPYLLLAKSMIPFRLMVSFHGADIEFYEQKPEFEKRFLRKIFEAAEAVTANSTHLLSEVSRYLSQGKNAHTYVVPMAFSFKDYDKGLEPFKHSLKYIFMAGRFTYKKGFDILIEAFADLARKNLYEGDLILAGEGEELLPCKRLAEKFGVQERVIFYGMANREQMVALMKGCDLFVMPSRLEAFGITLLEALYAGRKVIASRVGGMIELMEKNPNYLVAPGNPKALAEKITEILKGLIWNPVDPADLRRNYNWKKVVDSYLDIYQKVLNN